MVQTTDLIKVKDVSMSRSALAFAVSRDRAHISRIFKSTSRKWPSATLARSLARELECTVEELMVHLEGLGKPNPRA